MNQLIPFSIAAPSLLPAAWQTQSQPQPQLQPFDPRTLTPQWFQMAAQTPPTPSTGPTWTPEQQRIWFERNPPPPPTSPTPASPVYSSSSSNGEISPFQPVQEQAPVQARYSAPLGELSAAMQRSEDERTEALILQATSPHTLHHPQHSLLSCPPTLLPTLRLPLQLARSRHQSLSPRPQESGRVLLHLHLSTHDNYLTLDRRTLPRHPNHRLPQWSSPSSSASLRPVAQILVNASRFSPYPPSPRKVRI